MSVNSMPKENKMGTMPVKKLIFNMALPLIISMLIQALYNIVDSIFVSRISEDALTAVSLVFPVQNLMIAFATGTECPAFPPPGREKPRGRRGSR